jgi:hypothetical protein
MRRILLAFAVLALPLAAEAPQALSTRVVAYQIDARLDAVKKTIDATETLTYRNLTGQPLSAFPFHLYLNAFQSQSTLAREFRRGDSEWELKPEEVGGIEIKKLEVDGLGDVTSQLHFVHPDDDNADDRTVVELKLPRAIAPGQSVTFHFSFLDTLPQVTQRTGYSRNFFLIAQWFPKVGVWWKGAWNCHQFHANTEFFADFGTYDVKVTVPRNFVTGAGGDEVATANNPDGTKTVSYHGEDIIDFAWTADPNYRVVEDDWKGSAGDIRTRLLMQPGHMKQANRYMSALKGTMAWFDRWIGPYPYDRITVVDPAEGGFEAGGMEYPTFITGDTGWFVPRGVRLPETVVEHEFGHQYWYGMVATNEFEEAWMDEGINTYTDFKILQSLYGPSSVVDFLGLSASEFDREHSGYIHSVRNDPITRKAWLFLPGSYGNITYGKTGAALLTLETFIGEDTLRHALHEYFLRYRFTHPTGEDFFRTVNEVSGQDLRWFWDQAFYGTQVLDYEILTVRSDPVDPDAKPANMVYHSEVVVHRKGDFIFPTEVEIRFDNGEKIREHWDGRDRWIRYAYNKKAKLVSAEVDPDHRVALDVDSFNNGKLVEGDSGARRKIANYLMIITQFLSALGSWLV